MKLVRHSLSGTINDVMLAAITRGFRELLLSRGEQVDGRLLRTLVPVSVRAGYERGEYNNRVSGVLVDLPVGMADPVARLAEIRRQMDGVKRRKGAVAGERLVELAGFSPPMLLAAGQRRAVSIRQSSVNTATTNVPAPQHLLYFAGRRLLESAPTIPLAASLRVVVGIFSYDGNVQFGITGDYDSAADIGVLREGIQRGIAELVAIAEAPAKEAPATTVKGEPAARSSPAQKRRRNRAATTRHDPETSMSTSHIAQTTAEHALDRICALAALGEQTVEILSDAPKEC